MAAPPVLTPRQQQVLELRAEGLHPKEIARELGLAEGSVRAGRPGPRPAVGGPC